MKYTKILLNRKVLLNRNVIYILAALTVLGFLALAIYDSVENGKGMAKKFRDTHKIILPAY